MRNLILNLWPNDAAPGQVAGLGDVLVGALGEECRVINGTTIPTDARKAAEHLKAAIRDDDPEFVYVLATPIALVDDDEQFRSLAAYLTGRTVVYWEGDAWGRGKPMTPAMRRWLLRADHVFHTGGIPGIEDCTSSSTALHFAPNGYCHIRFAREETEPPDSTPGARVAMIGNNVTRSRVPIPGLTGIPGGLPRWRLARRAAKALGPSGFVLAGRDWPTAWSSGSVPFEEQAAVMRSARVSINWDHFASYPGYSSDRLPIALVAGRPHITTRHPRMDWCPGEDRGLFLEDSPAAVLTRALSVNADPHRSHELGVAAWEWARHRISTRELMRFLLSRVRPDVPAPAGEPWSTLPGPSRGVRPPAL